jgi:hypothetical protein
MDTINVADPELVMYLGSPERLMTAAQEGRLSNFVLASLLESDSRQHFLNACAALERQFTAECPSHGETCLADGCAMDGEVCLQALLKAGSAFQQACASEWVQLFKVERNRIAAWKKESAS